MITKKEDLELVDTNLLIDALASRCDAMILGMYKKITTNQGGDDLVFLGDRRDVRALAMTMFVRAADYRADEIQTRPVNFFS